MTRPMAKSCAPIAKKGGRKERKERKVKEERGKLGAVSRAIVTFHCAIPLSMIHRLTQNSVTCYIVT